ncbi:unnamed protein product [Trifolium pratense]|uniref:Uncharacterized protein n=1 Tax=Trifolium pratense TaxID=57577 RepID=A0ACB0KLY9_TRIPR|nr:unnamed protein product [Trifolium pratense]
MVEPTERYAVVTGANKGIGFEIVRQLLLGSKWFLQKEMRKEVNNAGIGGVEIKDSDLYSQVMITNGAVSNDELKRAMTETYELGKECIQINYHGAKTTFEYLLPLLQLSDSPRVVNVSSLGGKIEKVSNEWAKGVLSDVDNLTEERIDEVLKEFLKDYEEGSLERKGWPRFLAAYIVAKASMNAYT